MPADAEVVVVGAGPAGAALAIQLGRAGITTMLFDRATFPRDKPCGEGLMPSGVRVLEQLGIDVDGHPRLGGVTYRVPGEGSASGDFVDGRSGLGVRRVAFDAQLAGLAASTPNVLASYGCEVSGMDFHDGRRIVRTARGDVDAPIVVAADGLHSHLARWTGWARAPRRRHRFALVGHAEAPHHGVDRVLVTVLEGCEVYTAPTGADELLVAVLGTKSGLRRDGERARDAYARHVGEAHPELSVARVEVRGVGPFWVRPSQIAGDGVFLLGDAAGFLDPLTGDGMSDALVASTRLAHLIATRVDDPASAYTRWEAGQWRRRVFVSRLALLLTGSSLLARRALRRLQRRPVTLNRLLEVNDGTRSLWSLSVRDWAALAGV
jgi:flavin-dependent dehydrogenase